MSIDAASGIMDPTWDLVEGIQIRSVRRGLAGRSGLSVKEPGGDETFM